jgi:hypothetical protein
MEATIVKGVLGGVRMGNLRWGLERGECRYVCRRWEESRMWWGAYLSVMRR